MPKGPRKPNIASGGVRYTEGKPRYDLIPPEVMIALAHHYEVGARAHGERNWEKGLSWCSTFKSIMSHAWAWMRGEEYDKDTGSHHMICIIWNAVAIYTFHIRDKLLDGVISASFDDRPLESLLDYEEPLWKEPDNEALDVVARKLGVKAKK